MGLWLLTRAFRTGNPLHEGLEGVGRRGSYSCLPEHKTGHGAVKNNMGTKRDFPSTQGISTQSRNAVPTRTSLLGTSNQKDQKHISKLQATLLRTACRPGLGGSSHLCRGQTQSSCTLLHPRARENGNGFAGTFPSSFFFCLGCFFFSPPPVSFYDYSIFFFLNTQRFFRKANPPERHILFLRRRESTSRDPPGSVVPQSSSSLPSEPGRRTGSKWSAGG